ncbi:hypothetical protein HanIR_Chr08g0351521 [Helianthus annuus]|nr:hypothetical protein HanIR_Chr08g0351521 [Helianthus annuus]
MLLQIPEMPSLTGRYDMEYVCKWIAIITLPQREFFSCLRRHFDNKLRFIFLRAPNPRPPLSIDPMTLSQHTHAVLDLSSLTPPPPPKKIYIYIYLLRMLSSLSKTPCGTLKSEKK